MMSAGWASIADLSPATTSEWSGVKINFSHSVGLVPADAMELRDELTAWLKTLPVCSATEPNPYGTEHRCWKPEGHRGDHECACAVRWLTPTPPSPTMNR